MACYMWTLRINSLKFLQPLKKEPVYLYENSTIQLDQLNTGFNFGILKINAINICEC